MLFLTIDGWASRHTLGPSKIYGLKYPPPPAQYWRSSLVTFSFFIHYRQICSQKWKEIKIYCTSPHLKTIPFLLPLSSQLRPISQQQSPQPPSLLHRHPKSVWPSPLLSSTILGLKVRFCWVWGGIRVGCGFECGFGFGSWFVLYFIVFVMYFVWLTSHLLRILRWTHVKCFMKCQVFDELFD